MVQRLHGKMEEFNRELYKIDPRLELVFLPPNAEVIGAIPGRYHVLNKSPNAPVTVIPITGPDGEFVEPDSGLFAWLARNDMWNSRAKHDRERIERNADAAAQRQRERETEERQAELVERWKAATETSISMNRSSPWTQTAKARRAK